MAEQQIQIPEEQGLSPEVSQEIATMTGTDRAALLALLMAETQAAEVVSLLRPKEVSALGRAMVNMQDTSPEAVDHVLDTFLKELKALEKNFFIGLLLSFTVTGQNSIKFM